MLSDLFPKSRKHPDYVLLTAIGSLLALGILILSSVSASFSFEKSGDTYYFLKHQLIFGLLPGLALGYLAFRINLSALKKWSPVLLLFTFLLMIAVFLPAVGSKLEGASRWLNLGFFSFQPSELLKLSFILYVASWLTSQTENKSQVDFNKTFRAFLAILTVIVILLFLQSNLSTLIVIAVVGVTMYLSLHTPLKHIPLIFALGAGALVLLIKIAPYRMNRFLVFLNPDLDPMGIGYQLKQSLIAVGSGGIAGVGLGMSAQKLGYLPQTISDSIFAVFAEETGFLGSLFLVSAFLFLAWRGFKIAKEVPDKFLKLTALGITSWIIVQSFVNIGAMIGIVPLTGIPLPFISYGGSALAIELAATGILLNISKNRQ